MPADVLESNPWVFRRRWVPPYEGDHALVGVPSPDRRGNQPARVRPVAATRGQGRRGPRGDQEHGARSRRGGRGKRRARTPGPPRLETVGLHPRDPVAERRDRAPGEDPARRLAPWRRAHAVSRPRLALAGQRARVEVRVQPPPRCHGARDRGGPQRGHPQRHPALHPRAGVLAHVRGMARDRVFRVHAKGGHAPVRLPRGQGRCRVQRRGRGKIRVQVDGAGAGGLAGQVRPSEREDRDVRGPVRPRKGHPALAQRRQHHPRRTAGHEVPHRGRGPTRSVRAVRPMVWPEGQGAVHRIHGQPLAPAGVSHRRRGGVPFPLRAVWHRRPGGDGGRHPRRCQRCGRIAGGRPARRNRHALLFEQPRIAGLGRAGGPEQARACRALGRTGTRATGHRLRLGTNRRPNHRDVRARLAGVPAQLLGAGDPVAGDPRRHRAGRAQARA